MEEGDPFTEKDKVQVLDSGHTVYCHLVKCCLFSFICILTLILISCVLFFYIFLKVFKKVFKVINALLIKYFLSLVILL